MACPGGPDVDKDLFIDPVEIGQAPVTDRFTGHRAIHFIDRHEPRSCVVDFGRILERRSNHSEAKNLPHERQDFLLHRFGLIRLRGDDPNEVKRWRELMLGKLV